MVVGPQSSIEAVQVAASGAPVAALAVGNGAEPLLCWILPDQLQESPSRLMCSGHQLSSSGFSPSRTSSRTSEAAAAVLLGQGCQDLSFCWGDSDTARASEIRRSVVAHSIEGFRAMVVSEDPHALLGSGEVIP